MSGWSEWFKLEPEDILTTVIPYESGVVLVAKPGSTRYGTFAESIDAQVKQFLVSHAGWEVRWYETDNEETLTYVMSHLDLLEGAEPTDQ